MSSGPVSTSDVASEADSLATLVLACPGVAGLDGGGLRQVATYLPSRRVLGVRADDDRIEVAVDVRYGATIPAVVESVRRALTAPAAGRRIDVLVADVIVPGDSD